MSQDREQQVVPLPEIPAFDQSAGILWSEGESEAIKGYCLAYGNARAAAARREALEEAAEQMKADAETWGPALNDAGWEFMNSYRRHMGEVESGKLFNMAKTILRDCIGVYVKKATSRAAMKAGHD